MKRGVIGGIVLGLIVACGSARMAPPPSAPPGTTAMEGRPAELRAEIERLDADIAKQRTEAGLGPVGPYSTAVCTPPSSPPAACVDVCTLGDAICDDADKICTLAEQLPGDAWAAEKCDSGRKSCNDARQRCCDCH